MSTIFNMVRDVSGAVSYLLPNSVNKYNTTLAANVEQNVTLPSNYNEWEVIFSYEPGSSVWICLNDTATLPGLSIASTSSELNPVGIKAKAGDKLSFITADTSAVIGFKLYAYPNSNTTN